MLQKLEIYIFFFCSFTAFWDIFDPVMQQFCKNKTGRTGGKNWVKLNMLNLCYIDPTQCVR